MGGMDTKMIFTLKDLIMLAGFLGSGLTAYFSITGDIDSIKKDQIVATAERTELKEANKAYVNLPKDVKDLTIAHAKTAKVVEAIYLGLVAEGTIKPPQ